MPAVATAAFHNEKAGGAFENAAEEILNGIFCHYEPPASTKSQKSAADAVRENPTRFLYEEQPTKPVLRKKLKVKPSVASTPKDEKEESKPKGESQKEEEREDSEDPQTPRSVKEIARSMDKAPPKEELKEGEEDEDELLDQETPKKRGITWRDEESQRREEELKMKGTTSNVLNCAPGPCGTGFELELELPFIGKVGFSDPKQEPIPSSLVDTEGDENSVVKQPETPAQTPTKGVLKKVPSAMKVIYDDEGNPISTPRSPIENHPFFRSPTNGAFYEPSDYGQTSPSSAFKMKKNTPRPHRDQFYAQETVDQQIERLQKVGNRSPRSPSSWAPADRHVPTSPFANRSPKFSRPSNVDTYASEGEQPVNSVKNIVSKLNKSGFVHGVPMASRNSRSTRNYTPASRVSDLTEISSYQYQVRKKNLNGNRGSLNKTFVEPEEDQENSSANANKPQFVGGRRISAGGGLKIATASPSSNSFVKSPGGYNLTPSKRTAPTPNNKRRALTLDTSRSAPAEEDESICRDPTPRQMSVKALKMHLEQRVTLPPTPRVKKVEKKKIVEQEQSNQEDKENADGPTENKAVKSADKSAKPPSSQQEDQETSNLKLAYKTERKERKEYSDRLVEKPASSKGFLKGIKRSFKKVKAVVSDIDQQRVPDPVRKNKKLVRNEGAVIRHV